jgi:hypothetical protein
MWCKLTQISIETGRRLFSLVFTFRRAPSSSTPRLKILCAGGVAFVLATLPGLAPLMAACASRRACVPIPLMISLSKGLALPAIFVEPDQCIGEFALTALKKGIWRPLFLCGVGTRLTPSATPRSLP